MMHEIDPIRENDAGMARIPSVDQVLRHATVAPLLDEHPRGEVLAAVRTVLTAVRNKLRAGASTDVSLPHLAIEIRTALHERNRPSLRRVVNATGVLLHTGLGRAPLAEEAVEAVAEVARGYCNLELDLETGERGDRYSHCRGMLCELTGAEDALVVNNNAAATMLTLRALAGGREVIISRGQIVEIGGSYRMPDIMAAAGCVMVEVGTTNRTRLSDYEAAVTERTAALIRVHTSNYRVVGFSHEPPIAELVRLARWSSGNGLLVIDDLGSGWLCADGVAIRPSAESEGTAWDEPTAHDSVQAGADICMFSGDKLLGGPQAGVIVGSAACIERMRKDPLARVVRPDKMTLAALEATLRLYRDPEQLQQRLPVLRMLRAEVSTLESAAQRLVSEIAAGAPEFACELYRDVSYAGGGALPLLRLPTCTVSVSHPRCGAMELARALRSVEVPIIARVHQERLLFDCRTLMEDDYTCIVAGLTAAIRELLEG